MSEQVKGILDAAELGYKRTRTGEYDGIPYFVVPQDMKIETLQHLVELTQDRPFKLKQRVELLSHEAFINYYNRFATSTSTIFLDAEKSRLVAVLDYHDEPANPAFLNHVAIYDCPKTKEWQSWTENNNVKMSQEEFALFIEDNMTEIADPDGATMLEIAASLKATNNVDFKSSIRLDNGQVQLKYNETVQGQAGVSGQLEIPEKITLNIPAFFGGAFYAIDARFRYRINPSGLSMWYTLIRPHLSLQHAVNDVKTAVQENMAKGQLLEAKSPV